MAIIGCAILSSCDKELDVIQEFPFEVDIMPIPNEVAKGETVEIRCSLSCPADYVETKYTVRYFQYDGEGELCLGRGGEPFIPNDRYPIEKGDFRLYYTSHSTEQQSLEIVFEDNHGQSQTIEFDFNNKREDSEYAIEKLSSLFL